jgi:hypothetical protein
MWKEKNSKGINIGISDVQSAFDVVQHKIRLDKLIDQPIHPTLWLIIKDLYSGLTNKVKWDGELSESFDILQGVRQGGILSTHPTSQITLSKRCDNVAFSLLQRNNFTF